jgi:uncharacterized phage-associated protein
MSYSATALANTFIDYALNNHEDARLRENNPYYIPEDNPISYQRYLRNIKINHLNEIKLQYLLFFTQVWSLQYHQETIIDDVFIAGQFGPIIPDIQSSLAKLNNKPLKEYITSMRNNYKVISRIGPWDKKNIWLIESIAREYGLLSATELSKKIIHHPGWQLLQKDKLNNRSEQLGVSALQLFFNQERKLHCLI